MRVPTAIRNSGLGGLPAAIQRSRDCPPFQARVVKPRILDLDAALQGANEDVGTHRRHCNRSAAHRPGIVYQQGDDSVAEIGLTLTFIGERSIAAFTGTPRIGPDFCP